MATTTENQPYTAAEIEAIHRIEADRDWPHDAQARIAHAEVLLDQIAHTIDTVPAQHREHAADLLDAAIELLERTRRRFAPEGPEPPAQQPPF